ncbi:Pseudouridine synthase [Magnetospirillum sp. LM-5]|uniref:pseudouridine synthase n=1 Tax=Magnetospirillum sp. LM-5 TaxID=2681466 RepID=UPI00137DD91B|nr:pseudouridine synthase [Magnetospirillum sp. LM-5]CAA7616531.1 Pseudouridine synthase [Magnetospirillum sp. LM-5]
MTEDVEDESTGAKEASGERIAKRIARAGICSRRDAERLIQLGKVTLNGKVLDTPAVLVTDADRIVVDGQLVGEPERTRVWRYHKPAGLVTTHRDPQGRPTVFEKLPDSLPRVMSVGRLDLSSEGLLLLTNDGELARKLELPAAGWVRRYRVRVHGEVPPETLVGLEKGITIEGVKYGPIKAQLDRQQGSNAWLTLSLKEGKNREVRRVMDHLGWPVSRLIRVAYGPFQLGSLEEGAVEEVPAKVVKEQLGDRESGWAKADTTERARPPAPKKKPARPERPTDKPTGKAAPHADRRRRS